LPLPVIVVDRAGAGVHARGVTEPTRRAVVGVADHSGWAFLVTVGADDSGARVVDRRRCELLDGPLPRQPYHAAEGLDLDAADDLVSRVYAAAEAGAAAALASLAEDLAAGGHAPAALTIRGEKAVLPSMATVLASHALIHAAEGMLYRAALAEAAARSGLAVARHAPGEPDAAAVAALGTTRAGLDRMLTEWGRELGPPWRKEHKQAAAAALGELCHRDPSVLSRRPRP
jgi:hypothetical protein